MIPILDFVSIPLVCLSKLQSEGVAMEVSFTEEQLMLRDVVMRFARKEIVPRCREHDLESKFDHHSFKKLAELGILGLHLPEEYGGSDSDVIT